MMECYKCHYLFNEYDEHERRQISWCTYNSSKTGKMNVITRQYICPIKSKEGKA